MQIPALKAERRAISGTKAMRKLRANGGLPGVLYGRGDDNINLSFSYRDVEKLIREAYHVVELDFGDAKQPALVRGLQRDHLGDALHHIDFIRIDLADKVKLNMPVHFLGTPRGAAHGGLLEVLHGEVPILCPASAIPKYIEVEVTHLEVGDSIRYKDLQLPEGAELTSSGEIHVVKCAQARRSEESTTGVVPGATAVTAATVPSAKGAPPAPKKEEPKKK